MREPPRRRSVPDPQPARRTVLKLAVVVGLALPRVGISGAQDDERRKARPQPNDRLVFAGGDRKGQLITLTDLPAGGPPLTAYPMDPTAKVVRDDSRLNQVSWPGSPGPGTVYVFQAGLPSATSKAAM